MRRYPILLTLMLLLTVAVPALAQEETTPTLEELYQMLQAQQDLLERQDTEIQRQNELIAEQQQQIDSQVTAIQGLTTRLDQVRMEIGTDAERTAAQANSCALSY